jgi:indolepyruvate ferredoxin oxidoreductase alpha subunit
MAEQKYIMGNYAITRGAVEAGVRVVAGYPGTPATEILEGFTEYPHVHAQWSNNEKVALEVATGASLANVRSMAVMKHNGANVCTDMLMHLNFTGVSGGMVLVSADDPGGLSSQNEEDSRILVHTYANLPVFDPSNALEAKQMVKEAYELSEKTQMCFVLRPVMRVCHSRSDIPFEDCLEPEAAARWEDDRERYIMSAVEVRQMGGIKRPQARHRWLNQKYREIVDIFEESPFNHIEPGDGNTGLIGCGMGYTYVKEAARDFDRTYPVMKLNTLPVPERKVLSFIQGKMRVIVFEEIEPVVENLIKQLCNDHHLQVEVLGRSGFYASDGELTAQVVSDTVRRADPELRLRNEVPDIPLGIDVPVRTRTQCVGCAHRAMLYSVKRVARKYKGIVFGDIGCHDAGSFKPLELQSTIYCMGSSIPMATGAHFAGEKRPVFSIIGDSTFFHMGVNGLINAAYQNARQVIVLADNGTTAMTGFQPHAGSGVNLQGQPAHKVDIKGLGESLGVHVHTVDPYDLESTRETLGKAVEEDGVSLVVVSAPCLLTASRKGEQPFEKRRVEVDGEKCTGCMVCVNEFGCPALVFDAGGEKVHVDELSCVQCGLCAQVCLQGAIS